MNKYDRYKVYTRSASVIKQGKKFARDSRDLKRVITDVKCISDLYKFGFGLAVIVIINIVVSVAGSVG